MKNHVQAEQKRKRRTGARVIRNHFSDHENTARFQCLVRFRDQTFRERLASDMNDVSKNDHVISLLAKIHLTYIAFEVIELVRDAELLRKLTRDRRDLWKIQSGDPNLPICLCKG